MKSYDIYSLPITIRTFLAMKGGLWTTHQVIIGQAKEDNKKTRKNTLHITRPYFRSTEAKKTKSKLASRQLMDKR